LFRGRAFHLALSEGTEASLGSEAEEWLNAVTQDLQDGVWTPPRGRKGKKERKAAREKEATGSSGAAQKASRPGGGMFAALEGLSD